MPEASALELSGALDAQIPLPAGEIHLWCSFDYESITDADELRSFEALLAEAERRRLDTLTLPSVRHQYLITRALVRTSLSRYAPVAPGAWSFRENAHGRPFIEGPSHSPPLSFNLSHTTGLIVVAVSHGSRTIGVDTEDAMRPVDALEIADRYFSPAEALALRQMSPHEQLRRFFAYWTLKEAFLKARGEGFYGAMDQITLKIAPAEPVVARFGAATADDASRWSFALLAVGDRHLVAVATASSQGSQGAAPSIRWAFGLGSPSPVSLCFPLYPV